MYEHIPECIDNNVSSAGCMPLREVVFIIVYGI